MTLTSNSLMARVEFSFKGDDHELVATIDLDACLGEGEEFPNFHLLLARANGIDPYSYLYDALESYEIEFSDPVGLAADFCQAGSFDWPGFVRQRNVAADTDAVRAIARELLGPNALDGKPEIEAALLAAYRAGKAAQSAAA